MINIFRSSREFNRAETSSFALSMQADFNEDTMDFCIGDTDSNRQGSTDKLGERDSADAVTATGMKKKKIFLKAPDELPAIFLLYHNNGRIQTANVNLKPKQLSISHFVKDAMDKALSSLTICTESLQRVGKRTMEQISISQNGTQQLRIFIAGDRSQVGKSSICLGILGTLLRKNYPPSSLAYIKPATQCEETQLVSEYCKKHGIQARPVGPVVYYRGFTRAFLNGDTQSSQELLEEVSRSVDSIATDKRVVLIDGVGYPAVGSITQTDNAQVALASGYPKSQAGTGKGMNSRAPPAVIIVGKRGVGDAVDSYNLNASYFRSRKIPVLGAIFNRLPIDGYYSLENCKQAVSKYFDQQSMSIEGERVFGFIPEVTGIATSRAKSEGENANVDLAMEHAETFIEAFSMNVAVDSMLERAAILRDNFQNATNPASTQVKKKARHQNPGPKSIIPCSVTSRIKLNRDQIEQAAKTAGAVGG